MVDEHELAINPLVQESINHNARTLTNIRSLSASLLGVTAGTLQLTSLYGFAFYILGSLLTSILVHTILAQGKAEKYFWNPASGLWLEGVFGNVLGFVLTWTATYNLVGS